MILFNSNKLLSVSNRILNTSSFSYDADALAFISAATITASTQMMAINDLVIDLKAFGLWDKMIAIYPFIGGTANSHKYNLKDPRDLDAAYRLVFSGGWTHSSTGALPNGTSGYANTFITPSTMLSLTSTHMAYYSRSLTTLSAPYEMGVVSNTTRYHLLCCGRTLDNISCFLHQGSTYQSTTVYPYAGFFIGSRTSAGGSGLFEYRNGLLLTPSAGSGGVVGTSGTIPFPIYIGAANNSGAGAVNYTNKECSFSSIGDGLTSTEVSNYYTAVQKYQGALNRQV